MTGLKFHLIDFVEKDGPILTFGDNSESTVKGIGTIKYRSIMLHVVFYVKGLKNNLVSISQLCDASYKYLFDYSERKVTDSKNTIVFTVLRNTKLHALIIFVLDNVAL